MARMYGFDEFRRNVTFSSSSFHQLDLVSTFHISNIYIYTLLNLFITHAIFGFWSTTPHASLIYNFSWPGEMDRMFTCTVSLAHSLSLSLSEHYTFNKDAEINI